MRRGLYGAWFLLGTVFLTQTGITAERQAVAHVDGPSQGALPSAAGGGGGGASPSTRGVFPVAPGNPTGVDAVPNRSPAPSPSGGGGGGANSGAFIRVIPGGTDALEASPPAPAGSPTAP